MKDYNVNTIKRAYKIDTNNEDGVKISSVVVKTHVYKRRGKMRGIQKIVPAGEIVFTFDKYKNGKSRPIIDVPISDAPSSLAFNMIIAVEEVGFDTEFNLILDDTETLTKRISKVLDVKTVTAKSISENLIKRKLIHKVSIRHYILNPFLFCGMSLSKYKLFEAQMRWEKFFFGGNKKALPFYSYSIDSIKNQEGYESAINEIAGEIGQDIEADIRKVMEEEVVEISKDEHYTLRNEWEKLREIVANFIKYYYEESDSLKLSLGSFVSYISNDKGSRHFVSWWNKQFDKGNFGIEFKMPYRMRNKYCRLVASIVSEYDLLVNDNVEEMVLKISEISGRTSETVRDSVSEDATVNDIYEHVVLRRKEFEFNKEN